MDQKKIAIIGAGIGGLVLARMLYNYGINAVVYESEPTPVFRDEGGILTMHKNFGELALKRAGLFNKYQDIVMKGQNVIRVYDKTSTIKYIANSRGTHSEVERGKLRNMLLAAIPKNIIRWDSKIIRANLHKNGPHEIISENGDTYTADIVVGADGVWSKIRPLVSDKKPTYSGITYIETRFENVNVKHKKISKLVGRGSMIALSDERVIVTESNTNNKIIVYFILKIEENKIATIEKTLNNKHITKSKLITYFNDWDEKLIDIIYETENDFIIRPVYLLPLAHRWKHVPGVTLLGDAAHVMTPVGSVGANQAILDGVELGFAIAKQQGDIEAALIKYEKSMFFHSKKVTAESVNVLKKSVEHDALLNYINLFKS